ncbi:MAG: serine/threonine protein kinase [Planctomycetales bacterium]|nr:serine/threonine protein kinase [Planctomycetales bacterium]
MNERTLAQLVSDSLSEQTSESELNDLHTQLQRGSNEGRSFQRLSALIQHSAQLAAADEVAALQQPGGTVESDESIRLSLVAKQRMQQAIRQAMNDEDADSRPAVQPASSAGSYANSTSYAGLVAETIAPYASSSSDGERQSELRESYCRFTLIRKIGEGGLGTVWLARDEVLKRHVALKELRPQAAASEALWKRFQREAEITGHLEHPNVVPLYVSGVNPDTQLPFYAMRFLGRQTLVDAIREYHAQRSDSDDSAVRLHRLLSVFIDVCQAIGFAHSRGVVHRDLKPENVALDNFGQVLVLDWGLAKLDSDGELAMRIALSGDVNDSALAETIDGDVIGTPLYMSPEQARGELDSLDHRTDVFGLGAILFSILTGFAPHQQSSNTGSSARRVAEFLAQIASMDKPPLPRDLNPDIPRDLEGICLKAMAYNRYERHASAEELAGDVEAWIAGKHRRQAQFETMRMHARDLKSRLCVQLRQMSATAQFMLELPPIQGLLQTHELQGDEYATWRDRLTAILLALAKSRPSLSGLSYALIQEDRINELVRIERSLQDSANIRSLPTSRLRRGMASTFHKTVLQQFPGESCFDLDFTTVGQTRIVCGVPVLDGESAEPAGLVIAESEIVGLLKPELSIVGAKEDVFVLDDRDRILFSNVPLPDSNSSELLAADVLPGWQSIKSSLVAGEAIDVDGGKYGTQLTLPQKNRSLRILFQLG